jgi:Ger(x)C family germination protein
MKKILTALALVFFTTLSGGCWDRKEIVDLALITGYSFDYAELEGGKPGVRFTVQVVNPAVLIGGQGGTGGTLGTGSTAKLFWTATETGETVRSTLTKLNYRIPKQVFFSHSRVALFGEKAARNGLSPYLDRTMRSRESRENNYMAVSKGDASSILEQEMPVFRTSALALYDTFSNKEGTQAIMSVTLSEFVYRLNTGSICPVAPVVEVVPQTSLTSEERKSGGSKNTVAISGVAAFDQDGHLVDFFNERETLGLMWVLNKSKLRVLTVPYFTGGLEEPITLNLVRGKSKTVVSLGEDGMPSFAIKINAKFDVLEQFGNQAPMSDAEFYKSIEEATSSQIINEIEAAVNKSRQLNTDVFGFGEEVHRQHYREWQQLKDNWRETFPGVNVTVECETSIRHRGLTVEAPGSRKEGAGE